MNAIFHWSNFVLKEFSGPLGVPRGQLSITHIMFYQNWIKNVGWVICIWEKCRRLIWADTTTLYMLYWTLTPQGVTRILTDLQTEHNSDLSYPLEWKDYGEWTNSSRSLLVKSLQRTTNKVRWWSSLELMKK